MSKKTIIGVLTMAAVAIGVLWLREKTTLLDWTL